MKLVLAVLAVVLVLPVLLFVAVALGPVIVGILCALGFGLLVFAVWSFLVALGLFGRSLERGASRHRHHVRGPRQA